MADVKQTCGVQPSDETDSGNLKVVVYQESGRGGKSKLVCDVHHSQQQCALPQEDSMKKVSPSLVCDLLKASETAQMSSDSNSTTPHVHPNRNCGTYMSSISVCQVFKIPKFFIYSLFIASFLSGVSGGRNCDKVLTAHDVESKPSNDLYFHNGLYKEIEDDAFANASTAEHLDLSSNCFQTVPKCAFDNLTNVHSINMGDNEFIGYPWALQRPDTLKNLRDLKFEKNHIPYLGKYFFKGKSTVVHMNFAQNQVEIIHKKALDPMLALIVANFSRNKVTSPPQLNLTQQRYLRQIDLEHCLLKTLEIGYYSSLPEVTSINITDKNMSLKIGTERVVVFLIGGNSETISCEENEQDILRSKVVFNYTISCKFRNGSRHVLKRLNLPQNSTTAVMSDVIGESTLMSDVIGESTLMADVIGESTTLHTNNEHALIHAIKIRTWFLALFVFLFICAVVIIILLCWKGNVCQHTKIKMPFRARNEVHKGSACQENGLKVEVMV